MQHADVAEKIDWEVHFEEWNNYPRSLTRSERKGGNQKFKLWGVVLAV